MTLTDLLHTHPNSRETVRTDAYSSAGEALLACAEACTICADACLAEENPAHLRRCIRTDLDCADICHATARLVLRQTESIPDVVRQQLHACVLACQVCADECAQHEHEHCRLCAEACRRCQEACNRLLGEIGSSGTVPDDPTESPALTTGAQ
jgi:hypothetical protein